MEKRWVRSMTTGNGGIAPNLLCYARCEEDQNADWTMDPMVRIVIPGEGTRRLSADTAPRFVRAIRVDGKPVLANQQAVEKLLSELTNKAQGRL